MTSRDTRTLPDGTIRIKISGTPRPRLPPKVAEQSNSGEAVNGSSPSISAQNAPELLLAPGLMERIADAFVQQGYAGDNVLAPMLVYISLTSRLLPRPVNVALVAPSASGKNKAVDVALALMPPEAFHEVQAASPMSAVYSSADLRHRMLVMAEADSLPDQGRAASAIRSLIQASRFSYEVTVGHPGGYSTQRITKDGPTGLVTTTVQPLAHQLGTRIVEYHLPESREQLRTIARAQARIAMGHAVDRFDTSAFVAAQEWLAVHGTRHVTVPYALVLADLLPIVGPRISRDSESLFTTIRAIALLHQLQRDRDPEHGILATPEDYDTARELLLPAFESVMTDSVSAEVRETVEAIQPNEEISSAELRRRLVLSKGGLSNRVNRAIEEGWIIRGHVRKGQLDRLRRGDPLPETLPALPTGEDLRRAIVSSSAAEMLT